MLISQFQQNDDGEYWIDCRINSLYRFLLYYGIEIPRNYIFLLSEAYTFYYMHVDFKDTSISNIPFAVASESDIEQTLFKALEIQSVTERFDQSAESFEKLKDFMCQQKPVLMHTMEQMFIKNVEVLDKLHINIRMQSIPILIGIDDQDNYILYWITSLEQHNPIMVRDKKTVDRLRNVECAPYPPDYQCTYITHSPPDVSKESLIQRLHQAVKNVTQKMLYGVQTDSTAIQNLNAVDSYSGLEALAQMNQDLRQMFSTMQKYPEDVSYQKRCYLSILILKVFLFKGSRSSFRHEFASALCQLADETVDNALSEIGRSFMEISTNWKKLFVIVSRLRANDFDATRISEVCDSFTLIYEQEAAAFRKLADYYNLPEVPLC